MSIPGSLTLINDSSVKDLIFEVYVDNVQLCKYSILHRDNYVEFNVPDDDGTHELKFVLSGKTDEHTVIDENGTIISDVLIKITDVEIDHINIDRVLFNQAEYHHNFNGNGCDTIEPYAGIMGCNGDIKLEFNCPFYIWLLENT